jgi:hypothetical protein
MTWWGVRGPLLLCGLFLLVSGLSATATSLNARDFGAVGDGVADDTGAVQQAIHAAGARAGGGELRLPAGTYRITRTLVLDRLAGLLIRGEGSGGLRPPLATRATVASLTTLVWAGDAGGTLLALRGCTGVHLEHIALLGRAPAAAPEARAGILIHVTSTPEHGDLVNRFSSLSLHEAAVGLQFGTAVTDTNASDYLLEFLSCRQLGDAIRVMHNQGVDFLIHYLFGLECERILHMIRGGNVQVNTAQLTDCGLFAEIGGGGRCAGTYLFQNVRLETRGGGKTLRRQLLRCFPVSRQAVVRFVCFDDCQWDWQANVSATREIPLCEIGPGSLVTFDSSIFNSPLASLTGTQDTPASLLVRDSSFGFITPADAIRATTFGYYKVLTSTNDRMVPLPELCKWPVP